MPPAVVGAGAPPPIAAIVQANPSAEKPVWLPANHPLVAKTIFLGYSDAQAAGGVAQKCLSNSQMLRAFGRRCKLSQAPGVAPAVPPGIFQLALSAQGWTKVLAELIVSGILNLTFADLDCLDKAIDGLTIVNPGNLILTRVDLDLGEDTLAIAAVAAVPAVPAAGRRISAGYLPAQPAIAGVPGRPALDGALAFLDRTFVTVSYLEIDGVAPWANVVYLCGALGSYLTQRARNGMGSARMTASALAMGMFKTFGIAPADNLSLAGELPEFLTGLRCRMPPSMRCKNVDPNDLRVEFRDSVLYGQGREERVRVETQRVHMIADSYPTIKSFILDLSVENGESYGVIDKARRSLLSGGSASADCPMHMYLGELEGLLNGHLAILQPAAAVPGANARDVIGKLVSSITTIRRSVPSANAGQAGVSGASASSSAAGGAMAANNDAVEAVLASRAHQDLIAKVSACNLATEAGRRDAFTAGFDAKHVYAVRALTYGEAAILRRDATLAALGELRPFLLEYTNYGLCVDLTTGVIPKQLSWWSIAGPDGSKVTFFKQFWRQDYSVMDWYGSADEPGMLSFLSALHWLRHAPLHVADHYCVPFLVRQLADFGQNLFCIQGFPDIAQDVAEGDGFTWRTWWLFYADHLERALDFKREVQLVWLDRAHEQAICALRLMGEVVRSKLQSSVDIVNKRLDYVLPWDCAPANVLRNEWVLSQDNDRGIQAYNRFCGGNAARLSEAHPDVPRLCLPRRSERYGTEVRTAGKRPLLAAGAAASKLPPIDRGSLKRIRKRHPPINGRGPCYYHFQPGQRCEKGAACSFHHGT